MEDSRIIELYFERNQDAISESAVKYGSYCFKIAENILSSVEDSEECVNDTWLHAWNAIPPQRPKMLRMFFAKITRNLAFDRFSARTAEKRGGGETSLILEELAECLADSTDVEGAYEQKELGRSISTFVRQLKKREGDVFVRRYFFNESTAKIAGRYGLTENNVTVMLSRTRKKLKAHLTKEGFL